MAKPKLHQFLWIELISTPRFYRQRTYPGGHERPSLVIADTGANRFVRGSAVLALLLYWRFIDHYSGLNMYGKLVLYIAGAYLIYNLIVWGLSGFKEREEDGKPSLHSQNTGV